MDWIVMFKALASSSNCDGSVRNSPPLSAAGGVREAWSPSQLRTKSADNLRGILPKLASEPPLGPTCRNWVLRIHCPPLSLTRNKRGQRDSYHVRPTQAP